jgi:hypothetical protein
MPILDFDKIKTTFNLYNHRPRVFTWPIFGTLIFSILLFVVYKLNQYITIWDKYKQAGGNATLFCEVNRFDQLIVQPSNTWSNIGFIISALIILSIAKNDRKYYKRSKVNNLLARYPGFSYLSGFSLLYLGLGSFLYHASLTHTFQKLDQTGMYFVLISATAYNMYKLFPKIRFKKQLYSSHKFIIIKAISINACFLFLFMEIAHQYYFSTYGFNFFLDQFYCTNES